MGSIVGVGIVVLGIWCLVSVLLALVLTRVLSLRSGGKQPAAGDREARSAAPDLPRPRPEQPASPVSLPDQRPGSKDPIEHR